MPPPGQVGNEHVLGIVTEAGGTFTDLAGAPVTLATIKAHPLLGGMQLVKQSRLSVTPVTDAEWAALHALARAS